MLCEEVQGPRPFISLWVVEVRALELRACGGTAKVSLPTPAPWEEDPCEMQALGAVCGRVETKRQRLRVEVKQQRQQQYLPFCKEVGLFDKRLRGQLASEFSSRDRKTRIRH